MGLNTFAQLSPDETIPAPKFFRQEEQALAKVQRKQATLAKVKTECGRTTSAAGPDALRFFPERRRHRQAVARVHERVQFRRQNVTHQESRKIINRFGTIAVEDLHVHRMVHHHCLAKSIHDAAWAGFRTQLIIKAAGRTKVGRRQSRLHQSGVQQVSPAAEAAAHVKERSSVPAVA